MYEKVSMSHPDKIADRIAGAIVDRAYLKNANYLTLLPSLADETNNPKVAVEVLIGHKQCTIIIESSVVFEKKEIKDIVDRIAGEGFEISLIQAPQDQHLADNQANDVRCGDNGIFKGVPTDKEEKYLTHYARRLYERFKSDGKYILDKNYLIVCQSNATNDELSKLWDYSKLTYVFNPLGEWTGGTDVDTGATNRKLGSDMGRAVTGGGLHGKDLSKADVSVNIYLHQQANQQGVPLEASCAIGDRYVGVRAKLKGTYEISISYETIVREARLYVISLGGFEKLAEWGLIR